MNVHTKQQQDKVFETDFIGSQNPHPPRCAPFGTKSYIIIMIYFIVHVCVFMALLNQMAEGVKNVSCAGNCWYIIYTIINRAV